jgi:hypothetical protein
VVVYLASFTLFFLVCNSERVLDHVDLNFTGRDTILQAGGLYQRAVTADFRPLRARYTALVTLDQTTLPAGVFANA